MIDTPLFYAHQSFVLAVWYVYFQKVEMVLTDAWLIKTAILYGRDDTFLFNVANIFLRLHEIVS